MNQSTTDIMINYNGAGVLIHNGEKVLLCLDKRSKKWSIPKGRKENNETPEECWTREFKEETGMDLSGFHVIENRLFVNNYHVNVIRIFDDILPRCYPRATDDGIVKCKWVKLDEVQKYKMNLVTDRSLYHVKNISYPDEYIELYKKNFKLNTGLELPVEENGKVREVSEVM